MLESLNLLSLFLRLIITGNKFIYIIFWKPLWGTDEHFTYNPITQTYICQNPSTMELNIAHKLIWCLTPLCKPVFCVFVILLWQRILLDGLTSPVNVNISHWDTFTFIHLYTALNSGTLNSRLILVSSLQKSVSLSLYEIIHL